MKAALARVRAGQWRPGGSAARAHRVGGGGAGARAGSSDQTGRDEERRERGLSGVLARLCNLPGRFCPCVSSGLRLSLTLDRADLLRSARRRFSSGLSALLVSEFLGSYTHLYL